MTSGAVVPALLLSLSILGFSFTGVESAAAPEPVRVGGDVKPPLKIKHANPVYPEEARQSWVQGIVVVDAIINAEGKVEQVKPLRSIPLLDPAAIDAIKQWEYEPTLVNGAAVPVIMTVTVAFTIPDADKWIVYPKGKAELKLEDYVVEKESDGGRIYRGRVTNLGTKSAKQTRVILHSPSEPSPASSTEALGDIEPGETREFSLHLEAGPDNGLDLVFVQAEGSKARLIPTSRQQKTLRPGKL